MIDNWKKVFKIFTTNHHEPTRTKDKKNKFKIVRGVRGSWLILFLLLCTSLLHTQEEVSFEEEYTEEEVLLEEQIEETILEEQEEIEAIEEQFEETAEEIETERTSHSASQRLEMEIRTSTLSELAVWCRSLGLSESGTRAELSRRLRDHFRLPEPTSGEDGRRRITIHSAQSVEYFTIGVVDEEYARLTGDVSLSLQEGGTVHRVRADEILFNRTRNMLTARGHVFYEKSGSQSTETFRGQNITVNLDDWSSIFLDGDTTMESEGTAYLISGTVISSSGEDVTTLTSARVTNAINEEALWSISTSRLWLLPGSDFAFLNAVLRVGEIPVMYLPFFYFPGDQLFFHPVFGYRPREGAFVQTTTYLIGQPRSDSQSASSITRILGDSNDMEVELEGLFLRSTGRRIINRNELSLRGLIDYYVNMGTYLGLELYVPATGILNPLELSFGLGFTRTISQTGDNYIPYDADGLYDWNHSNFFSTSVPFRYRMRLQSSIRLINASLSWEIPFYSDPSVNRDFLNRSERMDFFDMIQQGMLLDENPLQNEIGSYRWHIQGNINPSFPALSPYISRMNISNLSSTLNFRTFTDVNIPVNDPIHRFFGPDRFTIYNISGSITGTPMTIGGQQQRTASNTAQEREDPLEGIGIPISPWTKDENPPDGTTSDNILAPPVLSQSFTLPRTGSNRFSIDYQIFPNSSMELQYFNREWKIYEDVNWGEIQSILANFDGNSSINFRFDHTSGLFTNILTLSGNGTWRDFTYLNEDLEEEEKRRAQEQQFRQTNYSTSHNYTGTIRPFHENPVFGQSNLQYNLRGTLVRSKRWMPGTEGAELTPQWGEWAKENISNDIFGLTSHRLAANFAANIMGRQQNISTSFSLPPLDPLIETRIIFRYWICETNINFRIEKPETEEEWIYRPVNFTQALRFENIGSFSYNMIINPEENNEITNITTSLTLWDFRASFSAIKSRPYEWQPNESMGGQWNQTEDEVLNPRSLILSYNRTTNNRQLNDRLNLSFNVNTELNFDLQRYTNSSFQLTTGLFFNITDSLELRMSATSQNSIIWRYFKNIPGFEHLADMYPDGPQNNLFIDLFDSFNFFDDTSRRRSAFKMQRFDFSAIRYLGDWQAELGITMYPHRPQDSLRFEISTDVNFLIQWKPIAEIKSDIHFDGRQDIWARR